MPRRIIKRLWVRAHIGIWIHPLHVALHRIRREEDAHQRIIVPCIVIIQLRERVVVLAGVAFRRPHRAFAVEAEAVGAIELVALYAGAAGVGNAGNDGPQRIGEQVVGAAIVDADETASQRVVILVVEVGTGPVVDVVFQPEGGDGIFGVAVARPRL